MEDAAGSEVEAMANNLFGDPSLPYPDLAHVSVLVKFTVTTPKSRLLLMRVCMAADRDQMVRECNYCHSASMLLDSIESETALKIHVPLSARTAQHSYSDWANFSDVSATRTELQMQHGEI